MARGSKRFDGPQSVITIDMILTGRTPPASDAGKKNCQEKEPLDLIGGFVTSRGGGKMYAMAEFRKFEPIRRADQKGGWWRTLVSA